MARKKLIRIQEAMGFENIIHEDMPHPKESVEDFLHGAKKSFLELGCGRGEYTVGLSEMFENAKCIGVDIQGERIWHGARHALETKNKNTLFVRAHIGKITDFIPEHSIDEIWLPFSDPFPRKKNAKKRLTSERFLKMYTKILKPNGVVHVKTDNENLFWYSKETVEHFGAKIHELETDVPVTEDEKNPLNIQTQYEKRFRSQGKKIFHLSFSF